MIHAAATYHSLWRWPATVAALMVCVLLAGCNAYLPKESGTDEADTSYDGAYMSLAIVTDPNGNAESRTDLGGHEEGVGELPDMYDSSINRDDMAFYVFVGDQLVYQSSEEDDYRAIAGSGVTHAYTAYFKISKTRLAITMQQVQERARLPFRVIVLANLHTGATDIPPYPVLPETATVTDALNSISTLSFTIPDDWSPANIGSTANRYIPMFGMASFTAYANDLYGSHLWEPVTLGGVLGSVSMLRALAKVELIDGIAGKDDEGFPKVMDARFTYQYDQGNIAPGNLDEYQNGYQVDEWDHNASENQSVRPMRMLSGTDSHGEHRFRVYCPEQEIFSALPAIDLDIAVSASDTPADYLHYTVPLEGYNGVQFNFAYLLRNHIYQLRVNSVSTGAPVQVTLNVLDWEQEVNVFNYDEELGIQSNGLLQWTPGSYDALNESKAELVLTNSTTFPATGTFTIDSPLGATWSAYLVPEAGARSAIMFMTDDLGGRSESVSGTIDGKPIQLRVVPTAMAGQQQNVARLQVFVTLDNGRTVPANILGTRYGNNTYFTIIQDSTI